MNDISNICLTALKNRSSLNQEETNYCISKLNQKDTIKIFKKIEIIGLMNINNLNCLCQKINTIPIEPLMSSKNFKAMMNRNDFMEYILMYANTCDLNQLLTLIEPNHLKGNYNNLKEKLPEDKLGLIEGILIAYKFENSF